MRLAHFGVDVATGAVTWSSSAAQLFGSQILTPNGEPTPFPFWSQLVQPDPVREFEQLQAEWTTQDGSTLTLVARAEFIRDRRGRLTSIAGTLQDITEKDATRRALVATTGLLQRERETATLLQGALLPKVLPEAPGLELAAKYLKNVYGLNP